MFDEQPDGDPHSECAAEIHRLESELAEAKRLLYEASLQMPVGYQRLVNGKWEHCSVFVALGFGEDLAPGFRAVYAAPVPSSPSIEREVSGEGGEAADNQWFGDMMILQVLADSESVNEQEREVLTRWMAASDRPSLDRSACVTPCDGGKND